MKINDEFSLKRDPYNFIITKHTYGTNPKTNKPTHNESNSYYPSLELALLSIIGKSIEVESMQGILDSVKQAKDDILAAIKKEKDKNENNKQV